MSLTDESLYKRAPIETFDGIPVFTPMDDYMENYDRISRDHLHHFCQSGKNPFMEESFWSAVESSTAEIIRKYCDDSTKRILDVGVGMGRLLALLPELDRYGIDISRGYLLHARQKGINVCLSKVEDMPYNSELFDICVSTDVLEHVPDLNKAVAEMLRVIKPGGILVVRVPYREELKAYLSEDYPYKYAHLRNFDEFTLRILFEKIFNVAVLEWNCVGYTNSRLKYFSKVKYLRHVIDLLINVTAAIHSGLYNFLCRTLRHPIEINMVIRKIPASA